jgi:hypothetical protein
MRGDISGFRALLVGMFAAIAAAQDSGAETAID